MADDLSEYGTVVPASGAPSTDLSEYGTIQGAPTTLPPIGHRLAPPGTALRKHQNAEAAKLPPSQQPGARMAGVMESAIPYVGATIGAAVAPEAIPAIPAALASIGGAAAGAGVGSAVEQGAKVAGGAPSPGIGDAIEDALKDAFEKGALPEAGGQLLSMGIGKIIGHFLTPERLYQSGLKPVGSLADANKAISTGIEEGIPLTREAPELARARINALNTQIEDTINNNPTDIDPASYIPSIEAKMDKLRNAWKMDATKGSDYVNQIDGAERQFILQHGKPKPLTIQTAQGPQVIEPKDMTLTELRQQAQPLSAADAQAIKKQTYKTIQTSNEGAWDQGAHPGLSMENSKALAASMREELQKIYPDIGKLNSREGALIDLQDQLERYVKREGNKQTLPYFIFPAAGAALGLTHGGAFGAGEGLTGGLVAGHIFREALEDPAVKSRIAIAIDAARKIPGMKEATGAAGKSLPAGIRAAEAAQIQDPKYAEGNLVKLRNGDTVTIKKINGDGTIEYDIPNSIPIDDPRGGRHYFKDQPSADAFKKNAGIP